MIVEAVVLLVVLGSGTATLASLGMRGWMTVPLGFLSGLSLQQVITGGLLVATGSARPVTVLSVMLAPVVAFLVLLVARRRSAPRLAVTATGVGAVLAAVGVTHALTLVRYHVDSMVYLNYGVVIARDAWPTVVTEYAIFTRGIGLAAIHAPAALAGGTYLHAVTPLVAVSGLAVIAAVVRRSAEPALGARGAVTIAVLAALGLAVTNRFVFHAFYLNGHLLTGAWLAAAVGLLWLRSSRRLAPSAGVSVAVGLAAAGVVMTRPEGALLVALAFLPFLLSRRHQWFEAGVAAGIPAAVGVMWFLGAPVAAGITPSTALVLQILACTAPVVMFAAAEVNGLRRRAALILAVTEIGMWAVLAALVAWRPQMFLDSAYATAANTIWGKWGVSLIALWGIVVVASLWLRFRDDVLLRFPTTSFLPFVFLLVYLRDGTYRIGHFDSLNRMWLEWMLVATMFVGVAAARGDSRLARRIGSRLRPQEVAT